MSRRCAGSAPGSTHWSNRYHDRMADDPPSEAFLATLRRSRLLDPSELARLTARPIPGTGRDLADALVHAGALTHYQADKLVRGRWQGLVLGPYSILAPLGRGGMGTAVYLARDRRESEHAGGRHLLALKLLPDRKVELDPKVLARFHREMDLGPRVDHPKVVRTLASGESDGVHFLAMEYIPGKTLRQIVLDGGPLAVGDAARVFADVAAGLAHVHARGLIHRDVKPGNILVRPDGGAVLLDLGLAFAPGEPLPADPTLIGGRGYILGTIDYMAPEQARDATAIGPAADLYGLGCTLAFALTGAAPFPAATTKEKIKRHREDPPPALAHLPPGFVRIVRDLMAKRPARRPASAAEVHDRLLAWATTAPDLAPVDAVELLDAPGADARLWDAAPGDDVPEAEAVDGSREVYELDDSSEVPVKRGGCAGAVLLLAAAFAVRAL